MPSRHTQIPLSIDASNSAPPEGGSLGLRLIGGAGRTLTKAQKKFDRLLRKVESLRVEKARAIIRCDNFLKLYQEHIHPEERRLSKRRKDVVLLLAAYWRSPKGLGARQREQLTELLTTQFSELAAADPELLDDELKKLWEELHPREPGREENTNGDKGADAGAGAAEGGSSLPPELADMIRDMGLDPKGFKPGMSPQDCVREMERQLSERLSGEGADEDTEDPDKRPKSARAEAAERKAAERAARREEARKRTVVSIYKQLAKALHPDLEQDPALRERKHTLMQDLTKAYREGDLHTLLRLELEWIKREEGDLERLGDEKLAIYVELLEEQVRELQAEILDVPGLPRFSAVARFMNPFSGVPSNIDGILGDIRRVSESLKQFREAMRGPRAREELREALRQVGEREKRRRRMESSGFRVHFDDDF